LDQSPLVALRSQSLQHVRRGDQRGVGQPLRKVAQLLARGGIDFLGEQAERVGASQQIVEQPLALVEIAGHGERLRQPEAAGEERAFVAAQAVGGFIAIDEFLARRGELAPHCRDGAPHAGVGAGQEPHLGDHEQRGVELGLAIDLHERLADGIPAALQHLGVHQLGLALPAGRVAREAEIGGDARASVQRHPGHDLAEHEVLRLLARLPNAQVRLAPVRRGPVHEMLQHLPHAFGHGVMAPPDVDGVEQLAVDVELKLLGRAIAHAHRPRNAEPVEILEHQLGQVAPAIHAVHDLHVTRVGPPTHPLEELQIMYGVDGRRDLPEQVLEHFDGYRGARPVRVGNGAAQQFQLDVYGELLDTVDIWRRHHAMTEGVWKVLQHLVDWTATHWREPDLSIWEPRQEPKHFVFSKVMAWVALNRGARIAADLGLPGDTARWQREAELVHAEVLERGWDPVRQTFVQVYGEPQLDAALLVIPKVRFLPRADPRVRS